MSTIHESESITDLATKQKRLRHLRTVAGRNLDVYQLAADVTKTSLFFTIHGIKSKKILYRSEPVVGSVNPTWRSMNLAQVIDDEACIAMTSFNIKVWMEEPNRPSKLILAWTVDLTGLQYVSDKVKYDGSGYAKNSMLFGFHNAFYGAPPPEQTTEKYRKIDLQQCMNRVDTANVKDSYTTNSLLRIQTVLRAIKQTKVVVSKVRSSIEQQIDQSTRGTKKKSQREMLVLKVRQLRQDLEWRTMQLQSDKETYEIQQTATNSKDADINMKFETLQNDKHRFQEKKKGHIDAREELIRTSAQLVMRRKQLISELAFIYPISEIPDGDYAICDVKLPNSENFAGQDEVMIAVALGHTSHLIQMICHFLDVPIRYTMEHRGSRSRIHDHIHNKLTDKERDFPLYSKGKEKFQFNYGVYLMNKNIAQVRYYCGLGTTDLRQTLPNLKSLLELRLGVKYDVQSGVLVMSPSQPQVDSTDNTSKGGDSIPLSHDQNTTTKLDMNISSRSDLQLILQDTQRDDTDSTNQPAVFKVKENLPEADLFAPCEDTFFQVTNSAVSDEKGNVFSGTPTDFTAACDISFDQRTRPDQLTRENGKPNLRGDLAIGSELDEGAKLWLTDIVSPEGDSELSGYHVTLQDATFIVNDSHESSPEGNMNAGTFKTSAMFSQADTATSDDLQEHAFDVPSAGYVSGVNTYDNAMEKRAAMLTSQTASFKVGMSSRDTDSIDEPLLT